MKVIFANFLPFSNSNNNFSKEDNPLKFIIIHRTSDEKKRKHCNPKQFYPRNNFFSTREKDKLVVVSPTLR